jgi:hypothetical protein
MQKTRIAGGICLTVGLVALGLWLSGSGARALAYMQPALDGIGEVKALSGSNLGQAQRVRLNGRQMRVLECTSPKTPAQILDHYCEVADRQTAPDVPFLLQRGGEGGMILWVSPQGDARAVCVEANPLGGARYRIIIDPSGEALSRAQPGAVLAGGLRAEDLNEFEVQSSVAGEDGSGMLILTKPGSVRGAANRLLAPLEARGYSCDRRALAAYEATTSMVVIPLSHPSGLQGTLSIKAAPEGGGKARASLTLYPGV